MSRLHLQTSSWVTWVKYCLVSMTVFGRLGVGNGNNLFPKHFVFSTGIQINSPMIKLQYFALLCSCELVCRRTPLVGLRSAKHRKQNDVKSNQIQTKDKPNWVPIPPRNRSTHFSTTVSTSLRKPCWKHLEPYTKRRDLTRHCNDWLVTSKQQYSWCDVEATVVNFIVTAQTLMWRFDAFSLCCDERLKLALLTTSVSLFFIHELSTATSLIQWVQMSRISLSEVPFWDSGNEY